MTSLSCGYIDLPHINLCAAAGYECPLFKSRLNTISLSLSLPPPPRLLLPLEHRTSVRRFVSLQFLDLRQLVGLLGRGISPTQGRYLHAGQHTQYKRGQTSMPRVGFEPTIAVFERAKTVHALDSAATVIGENIIHTTQISSQPVHNRGGVGRVM
jgi:hypothetical protein